MTTADLIVVNASVLTMDEAAPRAAAVAMRDGRILAVGSDADVRSLAGPATEVIDAGGATLLPGFVESHLHLFMGGAELAHLQLAGLHGIEAVGEAVRAFAAAHPDRPLLMAQGADYEIFGRPATRHDLDAILPDRPFAMTAADHHTIWANTAALTAAGILHGKDCGTGSEVVMGADGLASGELREPAAYSPVVALSGEERVTLGLRTGGEPDPVPTDAERAADRAMMARGLAHLARHGVTSAVNMDGNLYTLELLRELQDEGALTARVKVAFHFKPFMELDALEKASAMARDWQGDWLTSGFVKMFMDGVIDSGTAWMLNDYPDRPGWRSEPLFAPDRFAEIAVEADRRGLQIAVHSIGDAAVHAVIDGYAAARAANGPRDSRHRIEHIELIDRGDVARLGALGIVASVQPPHPPGAMDFPMEPTTSRIGRARWADAYRWRTLAEAGARLAFASDWPVSDVSVLRGIRAAVTRQPWAEGLQDERIGLMATLAAYTIGGAYAEHMDDRKGMLRKGYLADLVLLSGDIEAVAPDAIDQLDVALTICGGRVVYRAGAA
ncbi:MAG: amidohydrolase [Paracoccaceae bacterium]